MSQTVTIRILFISIFLLATPFAKSERTPFNLSVLGGMGFPFGELGKTNSFGLGAAISGEYFVGQSTSFALTGAYTSFTGDLRSDDNLPAAGIAEFVTKLNFYTGDYLPNTFFITTGVGLFIANMRGVSVTNPGFVLGMGQRVGKAGDTFGVLLEGSIHITETYNYIGIRAGIFTI